MKLPIGTLILLLLASCSTPSSDTTANPHTGFEGSTIVSDVRPLEPADSTDLREMALTLPILEDDSEYNLSLIHKNSQAATSAKTWDLPTDGAQAPVRVERLPPSPQGAPRIKMTIGPTTVDPNPSDPTLSVSKLERVPKGWRVLSGTTSTYSELSKAQ